MTAEELRTLNTNFLGGKELDVDLFYQLANAEKNRREMMRDWMMLRTLDTSNSFSGSDTYLSTKTLPDRFLKIPLIFDRDTGKNCAVQLIGSDGAQTFLQPIRKDQAYQRRNDDGYYYIDIKNGTISRTGTRAGTLYLNFIQGTVDFDDNSASIWDFPDFADVLIAYDVAIQQKGGIDWDTVNANQVPYNQRMIDRAWMSLCTWDAQLQQAELGV